MRGISFREWFGFSSKIPKASLPDVLEQGCASEFNISPGNLLLLLLFHPFEKEAELISIPGWSKTVR